MKKVDYFSKDISDLENYLISYEKELGKEALNLKNRNQEVNDQSFSSSFIHFDNLKNRNHLLLLGGMGPLAGVYGLKDTINKKSSSFSITLFQDCSIPKRTINKDITNHLYNSLLNALKNCPKDKNINLIVLCNSAHLFMDEVISKIDKKFNIKFHSLQKSIEENIEIFRDKKSVVLQTSFSLHNGIYENSHGLNRLNTIPELLPYQSELTIAIDSIKSFDKQKAIKSATKLFIALKNHGIQKVLLGCTEIPILIDYLKNFGNEEVKNYINELEIVDPLHITLEKLGD